MIALTYKIGNRPMSLLNLNIFLPQGCQFSSAKTTADQDRYHGHVSDTTKAFSVRFLKEYPSLVASEPVSGS